MAAEDATLAAVQGIAQDVRDLRAEVSGRLDQAVTRREHDAEIRRVDAEHQLLVQQHAALAASADIEHGELRALIASDKTERAAERQRIEDARRADRRVYLAVTVSALGVAVAIAGLIFSMISRT